MQVNKIIALNLQSISFTDFTQLYKVKSVS
jgi:hypothetical protein